jgi:hypothetical protein
LLVRLKPDTTDNADDGSGRFFVVRVKPDTTDNADDGSGRFVARPAEAGHHRATAPTMVPDDSLLVRLKPDTTGNAPTMARTILR